MISAKYCKSTADRWPGSVVGMWEWKQGHVCVSHPRQAWDDRCHPDTIIHCGLSALYGTSRTYGAQERRLLSAAYERAKLRFDDRAALAIVRRVCSPAAMTKLRKIILDLGVQPELVCPHPAFDDIDAVGHQSPIRTLPTNALPFAYMNFLSRKFNCAVDEEIVQIARVGRTNLPRMLRFLCQPSFTGSVIRDAPYIIVDDVLSTGGTFAALRSYIVEHGGAVVATTALAHKAGRNQKFRIAQGTVDVLQSLYGPGLNAYWKEGFGHDIGSLTEAEGRALVTWASEPGQKDTPRGDALLHRLRGRIDQAASKGS